MITAFEFHLPWFYSTTTESDVKNFKLESDNPGIVCHRAMGRVQHLTFREYERGWTWFKEYRTSVFLTIASYSTGPRQELGANNQVFRAIILQDTGPWEPSHTKLSFAEAGISPFGGIDCTFDEIMGIINTLLIRWAIHWDLVLDLVGSCVRVDVSIRPTTSRSQAISCLCFRSPLASLGNIFVGLGYIVRRYASSAHVRQVVQKF